MKVYNTPYDLLENIERYPQKIKIVLDYDLNCPVTGVDVAGVLYSHGYENLYLATGFLTEKMQLPPYLHILKDKMDLNDLFA